MTHAAWLVDLDGTLYHLRPVQLLMAVELLLGGPAPARAIAAFRRQHEQVRDGAGAVPGSAHTAVDPFRHQLQAAARALEIPASELEAVVQKYMFERPGRWIRIFRRRSLLAEIERFRRKGGRCALVSDYPARLKLAALRAEPLFEVVVASGEPEGPRSLKPDPDGYLRAAKRLGVEPASCLVVGDRDDTDGAAARAAGMAFRCVGLRAPAP